MSQLVIAPEPQRRGMGYRRVSSDPDHDKLSPEIQTERITGYWDKNNLVHGVIESDIDISHYKWDKRDGWARLETQLQPGDVLVVVEDTRVSRDAKWWVRFYYEVLEPQGIDLVCLDSDHPLDSSTAIGEKHMWEGWVQAQYEVRRLSERVRYAKEQSRKDQEWQAGQVALGYDRISKKVLAINEKEAVVVRQIFDLRESSHSNSAIAKKLNDDDITGKNAGKVLKDGRVLKGHITATTIAKSLRNPIYCGLYIWQGERFDISANVPPIITQAQWERVQRINEKAKTKYGTTPSGKYLLTGILKCEVCGSSLHRRIREGKASYICHAAHNPTEAGHTCPGVIIKEDIVVPEVVELLLEHIDQEKLKITVERQAKDHAISGGQLAKLERALEELQTKQDRLLQAHAEGLIGAQELGRVNGQYMTEQDQIESQVSGLRESADQLTEQMKAIMAIDDQRIKAFWERLPLLQRQMLLRLFVRSVTVRKGRDGRRVMYRGKGRLIIDWAM